MKIPITQTELIAMPNIAWRKFCDYLLDKDLEHTPIQRTAALCLRYYFEMQDSGHTGFFYSFEDTETDELAQALTTIGTPEFATNLIEAIENEPEDNFDKADRWFFENEYILFEAIKGYQQSHLDDLYEIVDENYTLRPPKDGFWAGAIIVAVVFIMGVIAASTNPNPIDRLLFIPAALIGIASTGLVLFVYAKRWNLSVKKDVITLCCIFQKKRIIHFKEISNTREHSNGIIIYAHGKRLIFVSKAIREYGMFMAQLNLAEKITDKQKVGFSIRLPKANIFNGFLWPIVCIWPLIWTFQRGYNPASIYEKAFFSAATLMSLWYLVHCLRWKVTVSGNSIKVRKALGSETEYRINDITKVSVDNQSLAKASTENQKMFIFVNDKKTLKIATACEGYHDLSRKLQSANVPFYRNGKRWRYETIPLEEQLARLSNFGINPKCDDFVEWMWCEWETDTVKSDPYELLMLLGGVREASGLVERLSNDVFYFDTGCVDDGNSYRTILEQLVTISKGAFNITNLHSEVDHKNKKASVSFVYCSTKYKWDLDYNNDWFDFGIVLKINGLLKNSGSSRFFYTCNPPHEQGLVIIFSSDEMIEGLNCLTDFPFVLRSSETAL